ncbi:dihydroorotate dehydrogenase electron transfer subunit [Methanospirillum hungatei]|uniref:dihydroorotate dehydrogenase electron transfer subunit n=1 Tax=Methanospirillum hungatei TaxID=2203 RepID=UPI0026EAADB1|nr:dihydroorotate dehydrogenase electron transfer subunit [Methanospirillum hungatei]MCA1916772.1 dihydroorotate dehydrogenase electron transfer subunit [Methanospirillum hungatei]
MSDGLPVPVTITRVAQESPGVSTIFFDHVFSAKPGQFVMVWVVGTDEIPMALSYPNAVTVQRVGEATAALVSMKPGDKIGIRGPFGNGFALQGRILAIAGGVGTAPLLRIGLEYPDVTFLLGARTADELIFQSILSSACEVRVATDDGSAGFHGYVAGLLDEIDLDEYETIVVCGPDPMMRSVLSVLENRNAIGKSQFSMHRYMKCGVGLCGSCCIDPDGVCVCKDGPVFSGPMLLQSELGKYHRNAAGLKEK